MQSSLTVLNDAQLNILGQETIPFWKEAYYSLVLSERSLHTSQTCLLLGMLR